MKKAAPAAHTTTAATTSSTPAAVDWAALQASASQLSSNKAAADQRLTIHALLREIHAMQLERLTAAQTHAAYAAQISALSANLQDALTIQAQMQVKIQLLEYGLKLERTKNAALAKGGANSAASDNATIKPNGLSGTHSRNNSSSTKVPSTLPGSLGQDIDPTMLAAYMQAIGTGGSNMGSPTNMGTEQKSMPIPPSTVSGKAANFASASNQPLSNATSALPSSSTGRISSSDNLSFSYGDSASDSLAPPVKSPAKARSSTGGNLGGKESPSIGAFKAPSLSASMFTPPTAEEIAAEIALAKSPPAAHANFFAAKGGAAGAGAGGMDGRSRSDTADRDALLGGGMDRSSSVYEYSNGVATAQPPAELPIITSSVTSNGKDSPQETTTYTYGSPDDTTTTTTTTTSNPLNATAIDLSGVTVQLAGGESNKSSASTPAAGSLLTTPPSTSSSTSNPTHHSRLSSSSSSAFTPLSSPLSSSAAGLGASSTLTKQWRPKLQLKAHLDAVRSVAWDRSGNALGLEETWMLSGSEDGTAQIWNLTAALSQTSAKAAKGAPAPTPLHSYRGHQGAVTTTALNSDLGAFTAGLDGQVIQWALPAADSDMYASHGEVKAFKAASFTHKDAVWSVDLLAQAGVVLVAVADGSIAIWKTDSTSSGKAGSPTLLRTIPSSSVPVSVQFLHTTQGKHAAVAYVDGTVAVLDVETGSTIATFKESTDTGAPSAPSRATSLAAHPTTELLVSGHVDAAVRMWDVKSATRTAIIPAHRNTVSSVSLDAEGTSLVSGSHDESIRVWSTTDRKIRQVLDTHQTHRLKYDEAIHCVSFHASMPYLASAGADGVVKVYC